MKDLKQAIQDSLAAFNPDKLRDSALNLLHTLGYASDRAPSLPDESPDTFIATIEQLSGQTLNRNKALVGEWEQAHILFQMQDSDIRQAGGQLELFESTGIFDGKAMESYVFAAVRLRSPHYTRTALSQITRTVNRLFPMPVIILFVYGDTLTLAIIERRLHKKDSNRDVLEKVTQIKDIRLLKPHRAHTEILHDLALPILAGKHECRSFVQLHEAWRKTLDTNELNKKFYRELADWYFWALEHVDFPDDIEKDAATRKATNVIRLLTRLIFCWFLKEKGLIPDALFSKRKLKSILKSQDNADSSFYLAILQNLFFGTLNQRMNAGEQEFRRFATDGSHLENRDQYGVKNLYRYQSLFAISEDEALGLFDNIPFLNGGLFDCLDKEDDSGKVLYVDGFTRNPKKRPTVPNFLFFSDYRTLDLSDAYGDRRRRNEKVRGLINLLESYKFTVTENTPIDEEIALDPELLGKVFENLLASYNPETGTTARKQTGSFYTPREIVNYMVDESLKAHLEQSVSQTFLSVTAQSSQAQTGMSVPHSIPHLAAKTRRNLPHWKMDGSIYWINFRLADSLPQEKLRAWKEQRDIWKQHHPEPWNDQDWAEYNERFGEKLEAWLDAGMGSRALARQDVREAVRECLLKFDDDRLLVHAAVIMPTHVHALIEPLPGQDISKLMKGIKGAAAHKANKLLGATGTFWMDESYDHIVRSQQQYEHFCRYIEENPVKAELKPHEYWLRKKCDTKCATDIPVCGESQAKIPVCGSPQCECDTDILVCGQKSSASAGISVCDNEESQTGMSVPHSALHSSQAGMSVLHSRLDQLFSYTDAPPSFTEAETDALIDAIDACKILDPACGSGAFPMGILHKLVFILGKLDPGNERWKQKQLDKLDSAPMREELERTFRDNDDDYGRKLYLIENCIYGVDIQPIAIQISKLRFFISLLCDQRTSNDKAHNCGVRPLPNLETKFVAANTLISLQRRDESMRSDDGKAQGLLFDQRLPMLEKELKEVRHKHFAAQRRKDKLELQKKDYELRKQIAAVLADDGMSAEAARQLAAWDPYDQNISAPFFDPEWMFGITDGVDITLGNPPYVFGGNKGISAVEKRTYKKLFQCGSGKINLFTLFIERGASLIKSGGVVSYILPNTLLRVTSYSAARRFVVENLKIREIVDLDVGVFDGVTASTIVIIFTKKYSCHSYEVLIKKGIGDNNPRRIPQSEWQCDGCVFDIFSTTRDRKIIEKLESNSVDLWDLCRLLRFGVVISGNIDDVVSETCASSNWKPFLEGDEIGAYFITYKGRYLLYDKQLLHRARTPDVFETKKIMIQRITGGNRPLKATLDLEDFYNKESILNLVLADENQVCCEYVLALLNSTLINWFYSRRFTNASKLTVNLSKEYVGKIPVRIPSQTVQHQVRELVREMMQFGQEVLSPEGAACLRQIDEAIYRVYELSPEEILVVQDAMGEAKQ